MPRPTIADIARRVGVSKGAVSFALNGRPGVSEATRARILQVAEEMNWRPHSAARALSGARAETVGLVTARPARTLGVEPFFAQLLSGLQARLSADSIALQLLVVEDIEAEMEVYRRWASEHRVDGLILVDPRVDDPRTEVLEKLGIPSVVLGGLPGKHGRLSSVWADDREAMLAIADYLAALGHTRIAHVAGLPAFWHTRRRIQALRDRSRRLGLRAESLPTDFSDAEGADRTRTLLSRPERPTAIVYDSDVMAVAGLGVATEMGVAVPAELSIVAFDESVLTRIVHPSLTCLSRDTFDLGRTVARTLLAAIADPAEARNVKTATPRLSVHESTAPPSGAAAR
ncbi:LacI family DNA-binding transcriptional regulator [Phytomonospora endophytica]|uniref:DNA-binding LacI/PurR family transcriptional regulator n=1 Tax=Phytomonospora endophytica TaxID=714109 RepID=A0A841FEQ6_9ACTN|nr:LacI family DNA-binding transcriptional regulator [Phytomonospora endophytica]MBB6034035.1 DNA-binding LacI/PurR family transcriptional regulator [Phytomonospora endophytica]GIG64444.1 LacI family transcriptional regulator [Phytomonospora endophytica]